MQRLIFIFFKVFFMQLQHAKYQDIAMCVGGGGGEAQNPLTLLLFSR